MQEIVPVDYRRAFCPLEGGGGLGGADILAPGLHQHNEVKWQWHTALLQCIQIFCLISGIAFPQQCLNTAQTKTDKTTDTNDKSNILVNK